MASALDQYDPDNLLNVIKELEGRIQALEQGFVSANSADELVSDGGDLGEYTGNTVLPASDSEITDVSDPDFTGLFISAEGVDIDGVVYSMGSLVLGVLQWGVVKDEPIIVVGDHAVELSDAGITAVAGLIGGWEIVTDVIQKLSADVGISLDATNRIIKVGNTAGNHIQIDGANQRIRSSNYVAATTGFNIDAATGDAEFNNLTATTGSIGGWQILASVIQKISSGIGIILDAANRIIKVGNTSGNHIQIDGANERIRSSNFVTGQSGMNIDAATGDAEFNNLVARGELRTFLLTAENQMAVSGQIMISKNAGKIAAAVSSVATTVNFGKTLVVGDWVKFHGTDADGNNSIEWMLIGTLVSGTTYNVTRNVDGSGANSWAEDTAFAVIGKSGDARIELVAGASGTIRLITQGATWNTQTVQAEMSTVDGAITAGAGGIVLNSLGMLLNDDIGNGTIYIKRDGVAIGQIVSTEPSAGLSRLTISQGKVAAGVAGEILLSINTNTSGDGNPNKFFIGTTTEINNAQEDIDTSIFGTSATPVIKVDASLNRAEISNATIAAAAIEMGVNALGGINTGTIADDGVYSFTPNKTTGIIVAGRRGGAGANEYVIAAYDTATPSISAWLLGSSVVVATGSLSSGGSGGTDTKFNVNVHTDGKIYLKNRIGSGRTWEVHILGSS